jgi:hypothetical protein
MHSENSTKRMVGMQNEQQKQQSDRGCSLPEFSEESKQDAVGGAVGVGGRRNGCQIGHLGPIPFSYNDICGIFRGMPRAGWVKPQDDQH